MYLRDLQLQEDDFEVAIKVKNSSGALNFSVDSNSDSINGRISREGRTKVWSQNHLIYILNGHQLHRRSVTNTTKNTI